MKKIGIVVADSNELGNLNFKEISSKKIAQFNFIFMEYNIVFVHSGIGITNAASATQSLIENFKPDIVINFGAVGANKKLNVYDVVSPSKIYYHDVVTPWYKRGQTPGESEFYINKLEDAKYLSNNIASGSSFLTSLNDIESATSELNVDIFDMEVAAIAQICEKNKVDLFVLKVVSDSIGNDNTKLDNINTRIKNAAIIAADEITKVILNLK